MTGLCCNLNIIYCYNESKIEHWLLRPYRRKGKQAQPNSAYTPFARIEKKIPIERYLEDRHRNSQ